MILPPYLHTGDLVFLISPAGAISPEIVQGAEEYLTSWGLRVQRGNYLTTQQGRFAGSDSQRLADLQSALDHPECKAIFCSRGGYGTIRLMEQLDLEGFRRHPKWLIGFSDITMLHALLLKEGYASIHGGMAKMLANQLESTNNHPQPAGFLHEMLWGNLPEYVTSPNRLNRLGEAAGVLTGGNLSILYSLRGTPYDHIPAGSILFIEDIGEKPYVIDRILHNLKLGSILKHLSGLIVGQFSDYEEDPAFGRTVYEIISDAVSDYSYPVCFDFPVGHVDQNLPLLSGKKARLTVTNTGSHLVYH